MLNVDIKKITVLGTGTMGHGIAQICAQRGLDVIIYGRSDESLDRGFNRIKAGLGRMESENRITKDEVNQILGRIKGVKTLEEAAEGSDFIIEALAENLELKQNVFARLDEICPENVILASNTSGLSPTAMAQKTKNPERLVVAHFWNPPQLIPLVEIVPGEKTSNDVMDRTAEFIEFIGKKAVRMEKECLGFIGNRLQLALLREALHIVKQGWAKAEEVDKAVEYGLGRRWSVTGPLSSIDLGGLDIFYNISSYLFDDLSRSTGPSGLLKEKVDAGKLGAKSGEGFYKWPQKELEDKLKEREKVLQYFLDRDKY